MSLKVVIANLLEGTVVYSFSFLFQKIAGRSISTNTCSSVADTGARVGGDARRENKAIDLMLKKIALTLLMLRLDLFQDL